MASATGRRGRVRRREISSSDIQTIAQKFFTYVRSAEDGPKNTRNELKDCYKVFKEGSDHGIGRGCSFSTLMYRLRQMHYISYRKGVVVVHEKAGLPILDQYYTTRPKVKPKDETMPTTDINDIPRAYPVRCNCCGVWCNSDKSCNQHFRGERHKEQLRKTIIKANQEAISESQEGVEILVNGEKPLHGKLKLEAKEGDTVCVKLSAHSDTQPVFMMAVVVLSNDPAVKIFDQEGISKGKRVLEMTQGSRYDINIECTGRQMGNIAAPVVFCFKVLATNKFFHIFRFLSFNFNSEDEAVKDLAPKEKYVYKPVVYVEAWRDNIEPGAPLPERAIPQAITYITDCKMYPPFPLDLQRDGGAIPQAILRQGGKKKSLSMMQMRRHAVPDDLMNSLNSRSKLDKIIKSLKEPLSEANYQDHFDQLLFIEECQMKVDIRKYDLEEQTFEKKKHLLWLKVIGLAEKRPSVLRGDKVLARRKKDNIVYEGIVHEVGDLTVGLAFGQKMLNIFLPNMKFDIQFSFNRFPLRMQHHVLKDLEMSELHPLLIPSDAAPPTSSSQTEISALKRDFFDKKLKDNDEQALAVHHILKGSSKPAPYLVFGPPGTGKTVTIVEAIKQVYSKVKTSRILACAPSNAAADLLTKRLLRQGTPVAKSTLLQMCAQSRPWNALDPELQAQEYRECFNFSDDKEVFYPTKKTILEKRVVITTLVTAGRLVLGEIPKGHFTHFFLDENSQAVEPESLIPVAGLLNPQQGQLVLAGDPEQLGPVLRSPVAKECGLEQSYLERLMRKCPLYQRQSDKSCPWDKKYVSKLVKNYRSHPAILEIPNRMFYDSELEACADVMLRERLCNYEELPKKGFPIIFHGVEGKDEREGNSPSFFNVEEVNCVYKYVKSLLEVKGGQIRPSDIGIISPYSRQVQKIRTLLQKKKVKEVRKIKVGSVEEFQGDERLVIIISTVRSTKEEFLKLDKDFKLGFLRNPKRLNVSITRAKSLLICVGNPRSLCKDEHWNQFLKYVQGNGSYTGCHYPGDGSDVDDIMNKLDRIHIAEMPRMTNNDVSAANDVQWRSDE